MATLSASQLQTLKKLYVDDKRSMREIAEYFGVSLNAVTYAMRKHGIARRTFSEMQALRFAQKKPSFIKNKINTEKLKQLEAVGVMLYWAEGAKTLAHSSIDFANSDPGMVKLFSIYLRTIYSIDEKRIRGHIYCYSDQNVSELTTFWSKIAAIPESQFTKPYIRTDFREDGRKMPYGLVHVRYSDKKLLLDILEQIEKYKGQYIKMRRW